MSCCSNHNKGEHSQDMKNSHHVGKHTSHKWMMLLCMLPVILVAVLLLTTSTTLSAGNSWLILLILLCPLSHFILMPLFMKKKMKH